ncbi:MAG: NAD-dependent epimerase/dehydratase family protein [bacterium]|nr:NAD-dependent epimerase/dehydratase family protein [bacterium]
MEIFKNKRVLITGGVGFIGSHLARKLVELGAKVTIVDSMIPRYGGNLFNIRDIRDQLKVNFSDIRDASANAHLVRDQDYLFNLAGQVSHIDSMTDPLTDLDINCRAQLILLEACRKYNPTIRLVYAGTRQVYGRPDSLPVTESHLVQPVDVNGINKVAGEYYHILYNNVYHIPSTVLRMTNVYGPCQLLKHDGQGFTGIFIRDAILGKPISIFGDGSQLRDFNFVSDVVDALLLSAAQDVAIGKVYNLGHSTHYSLKSFVDILSSLCEFEFNMVPFPEEKKRIDIGDYYSDYSLIKSELGWDPKVSLDDGLAETIRYYKEYIQHYLEEYPA